MACGGCNRERLLKGIRHGTREEIGCKECYAKMALGFGQYRFNKLSPAGAPEVAASGKGAKRKEGLELVVGQTLNPAPQSLNPEPSILNPEP